MVLHGELLDRTELREKDMAVMFALMEEYYDNMTKSAFLHDLNDKDKCIVLYDEAGAIKGFSTQKLMEVRTIKGTVNGVFSGDTIIHKDYWGSLELYKVFAQYYFRHGEKYKDFFWFLISKGYKTYRMLPVFFKQFYPNCVTGTPTTEKLIMDSFGHARYPGEYDERSGVIYYKGVKDRLKAGVADINDRILRDKNVEFFIKRNPGYIAGNDLVCLARLSMDNLRPTAQRLLLEGYRGD